MRKGSYSSPGAAGSQARVSGREVSRSPTRAVRPGERAAALLRRPPVHRPGQVDHEIGDGGRRQQRVVAARGQRDAAGAPREPARGDVGERGGVDVGEVGGGRARPRRRGQVGRLDVQLDRPGGLHPAAPDAGGGAEPGRHDLVAGEAVVALRAVEHGAEVARELLEDADRGDVRRDRPRSGRRRWARGAGRRRRQARRRGRRPRRPRRARPGRSVPRNPRRPPPRRPRPRRTRSP